MSEQFKTFVDGSAVTIAVGAFMQWVPPLAGLFTVLYLLFRALNEYETWRQNRNKSKTYKRRSTDETLDA